jgi:hypothetical protein
MRRFTSLNIPGALTTSMVNTQQMPIIKSNGYLLGWFWHSVTSPKVEVSFGMLFFSLGDSNPVFIEIYRRPFLALARMILHPKDYVPINERKKPDLQLTSWDVLLREEQGEIEEAQKIIESILEKAGISKQVMELEVLVAGQGWVELGQDTLTPVF